MQERVLRPRDRVITDQFVDVVRVSYSLVLSFIETGRTFQNAFQLLSLLSSHGAYGFGNRFITGSFQTVKK